MSETWEQRVEERKLVKMNYQQQIIFLAWLSLELILSRHLISSKNLKKKNQWKMLVIQLSFHKLNSQLLKSQNTKRGIPLQNIKMTGVEVLK